MVVQNTAKSQLSKRRQKSKNLAKITKMKQNYLPTAQESEACQDFQEKVNISYLNNPRITLE